MRNFLQTKSLPLATAFCLFSLTLGACGQNGSMVHDFKDIKPSANLTWEPCFDDFTCSRLQVPLDHSNKSLGTTSIAFIKSSAKNATAETPSIMLLPGGPGGSGVDLLLTSAPMAKLLFGEQYNIISFDPRGVNNSGPSLDCFAGRPEARVAFKRLHNTGMTNVSTTSLDEQYYSSSIYGDWCNHAAKTKSPHGYYVTTPAVARDLLAFIEGEAKAAGKPASDAKLSAYGISYGTVTGATFASIFPDRVERMILDGVVDADLYYRNDYSANVEQSDEAVEQFSKLCHSAGPKNCSFWGPSSQNIITRLDNIIHQLQNHPVPISGAESQTSPTRATYSDLKALILQGIYSPLALFPGMADTLHQIEQGNVSALVGLFDQQMIPDDPNHVIQCADASRTNSIKSLDDFKKYVKYTTYKSKYIGDLYPIYVDSVLCQSIKANLPESMLISNPTIGLKRPMKFPIMFASNTLDPITPLKSARKMSSRFPGSILVQQEGIGHTVVNQLPSNCFVEQVQNYFGGKLPKANTTCPQQYIPFIDSAP